MWAPAIVNHNGKYFLFFAANDIQNNEQVGGIGVAVADGPLGPFQDRAVLATNAIDAHLFQDDDGKLYLYYVDLVEGFKIRVQPMRDPVTREGDATVVIRPTEPWEKVSGHVTEGPFMLKRRGIYHLMYSGTGADSPNYGIGYATAESPLGPFKKYAGNPIARRGGRVLGPGHHCVVETPDGKLWLVYHQKWGEETSFKRFLAIDPLWFDESGVIQTRLTRDPTSRRLEAVTAARPDVGPAHAGGHPFYAGWPLPAGGHPALRPRLALPSVGAQPEEPRRARDGYGERTDRPGHIGVSAVGGRCGL